VIQRRPLRYLALVLLSIFIVSGFVSPVPTLAAPAVNDPWDDPLLWHLKRCMWTSMVDRPECDWLHPDAPAVAVGAELDQTGYVKAVYLPYGGLISGFLRNHVLHLLESTELNGVVIDVKSDRGHIAYPSNVDASLETGVVRQFAMNSVAWSEFMKGLQDRGVYTIARIVTFKDDPLASAQPGWAVIDSETGGLWRDGEGLAWTDPLRDEAQAYNIALAVEAAEQGFDEIQFDYVRFPSDGYVSKARFAEALDKEKRIGTIARFMEAAHGALTAHEAKLAADIFGYVVWMDGDLGIGQQLEAVAPHLDVMSPMLYPSSFGMGLPGLDEAYREAVSYPYEIVFEATRRALDRSLAVNPNIEIRPWIQDFRDYAYDRRFYTPDEIRLQMQGAGEAGARGWMLWDPAATYTVQALVSATPSYPPNTDGRVLVLEYHRIGDPEGRWQRTPDNFRADLERLLASGFYPVNLRDLVEGQLDKVPAGKRPLVLTFDDSTIGQFRLLADGTVDPDCAVGILQTFHNEHPADWPLRATFFVLQAEGEPGVAMFGQPSLAKDKLGMLEEWGMEIGGHTLSHANLAQLSDDAVRRELALAQAQLEEWIPGYEVVSLSVPYGMFPKNQSLIAEGVYEGFNYSYKLAVMVGANPARSPRSSSFDPYHVPRVQAIQTELDYWLDQVSQPGVHYVSAGE